MLCIMKAFQPILIELGMIPELSINPGPARSPKYCAPLERGARNDEGSASL